MRHAMPRGATLVEVAVVCAIAGILASVAWPSWRQQWLQAGRSDAVQALTRMEMAQARHHALHGLYASDVGALRGVPQPLSEQGRYSVTLDRTDAEGWRGSATAMPGSAQAADRECLQLTVEVKQGFASVGPSARCWNR